MDEQQTARMAAPVGGGAGGVIDFDCLESCAIEHLGDVDAFLVCAKKCGFDPGRAGLVRLVMLARVGDRFLR